jgi:uncharacterized protein
MRRLVAERHVFITTNEVLFELHALLVNHLDREIALRTIRALRSSQAVVRVRSVDEQPAESILEQHGDKAYSFTDALSFAVMERLGISIAFALDQHFDQFGC